MWYNKTKLLGGLMKRIIYVIIVIFSIFLISCKQESSSKMKIEGKDTIEIGFENEYKAYYEEEELDSDEFFWIIDNTNAVKRKGNILVGVSEGTVNLKAVLKSDGTIFASKTIEVIDSIVESISLRGTKTEVEVGTQFIVTIITDPFEAIDEVTSRWSASNDIVEIDPANDSAIITAKSEGVVTITVECSSATASFELKVNKVITEIEMYNDNEAMVNTSTYLSFNIDDPVIELLTENVEITNNYLYAKEEGVAIIKVSQKNNKKLSAKVFEINVVNNKDLSLNITQDEQKIIDSYLNKMSTKDKISQMFMLNLDFTQSGWRRIQYTFEIDENGLYYFGNNDISSKKYVASLINNYHFGGLKLCVNTSETESEISNIVLGMQRYYLSSNLPGGIISYYNEYNSEYGGLINTLSNLTLGTINNPKTAENYYLNNLLRDYERKGGETKKANIYHILLEPDFNDLASLLKHAEDNYSEERLASQVMVEYLKYNDLTIEDIITLKGCYLFQVNHRYYMNDLLNSPMKNRLSAYLLFFDELPLDENKIKQIPLNYFLKVAPFSNDKSHYIQIAYSHYDQLTEEDLPALAELLVGVCLQHEYIDERTIRLTIELSKKLPSASYIVELVDNNVRRPKKSKAY